MKSPEALARKLVRQWENADHRVALFTDQVEWPVQISIGRPSSKIITDDWKLVKLHINLWEGIQTGTVIKDPVRYRATAEPVLLPVVWELPNMDEWIQATQDRRVMQEYGMLKQLISFADVVFHEFLIRSRSSWRDKQLADVLKTLEIAMLLEPGCAEGLPLRALSISGIDTKFFERTRSLVTRSLDIRFDGEVERQGLEQFLNAAQEGDPWLLVVDLDGEIFPLSQIRARGSELLKADIHARSLIVVENERCLHMLPQRLPGTVAILGTGNNLQWLQASWVQRCSVAYWGDIDTWGLTLLHRARSLVPGLTAILMCQQTFDRYAAKCAVPEKVSAKDEPPPLLTLDEVELYNRLLSLEKGRLEQEFLTSADVQDAIYEWHQTTKSTLV